MRKIIVTSHVAQQVAKYGGANIFPYFLLSLVMIFLGSSFQILENLKAIGFLCAAGSVVVFISHGKKRKTYEHGARGETLLENSLCSMLSDEYIGFFGYPRENGQDIDCLLLGPSGLYVIEAKNHDQVIQYTKGGWRHIKKGQGGTVYAADNFKNPSGQVLHGLHEIKRLLEQRGIKLFIEGVVVFTNPTVRLNIEKDPKPAKVYRLSELGNLFSSNTRRIASGKQESIERELRSMITRGNGSSMIK